MVEAGLFPGPGVGGEGKSPRILLSPNGSLASQENDVPDHPEFTRSHGFQPNGCCLSEDAALLALGWWFCVRLLCLLLSPAAKVKQ